MDSVITNSRNLSALAVAAVIVAGCTVNAGGAGGGSGNPGGPADTSPGAPSAAEQACLRDVTQATNNPDVVLLNSSVSEAGTEVIVGVGGQRAPWRCIGYNDGTTTGILFLGDEGRL